MAYFQEVYANAYRINIYSPDLKVAVALLFAAAVFAILLAVAQSRQEVPHFSGVWHRWFRPGLGPSASGPGPLINRSLFGGVTDYNQLVGDYTNPILKRQAAATVKQLGELSLKGIGYGCSNN